MIEQEKLIYRFSQVIPPSSYEAYEDGVKINFDHENAIQCGKIADDYAIEFLEWVWGNCFNIFNNRFLYKDEEYSTKELLEQFKKEKVL